MHETQKLSLKHLFSSSRWITTIFPTNSTAHSCYQHPLSIPEILENVLIFVSPRNRQRVAQLVNKQWRSICQDLVPVSIVWPLLLSAEENQSVLASIHYARELKITYDMKIQPEIHVSQKVKNIRLDSWSSIMKNISESIMEHRPPKLRSLSLTDGVILDARVQLQQLPMLYYLISLKIEIREKWSIMHLFGLFQLYPNLQELVIKPAYSQIDHSQGSGASFVNENQPINSNPLQTMAKLRCCILYNPSINVQTLRVILGVCPQLLELKLIETYCFTDRLMSTPLASKTPIIDVIRARCPVLKRLHFSCAGDRLSSSEMKLILDDFPALEEYSIACKDSKLILMTEIRAIVNVITTLNLLDTRNGYWDSNVNLREILCTFVHLIHLRAPTAVYFREDMEVFDPYGGVHSLWINSHGAAEYDIAGDPTGKYVWVCRGLKTLHMSVGYRFSDSNVPYRALAMYGFLSRMCPQLEELHLWRSMLDLSFNSGICLLTRLQYLRQLRISTSSNTRLDKKDFFWLRLLPSTMDMINYTQLLIRIRREIRKRSPKFKNAIKQIQATLNARELGVDISKVGLGEDLIEWMHERYGSQNLKTWPQLEQFYIEYPGYKDDAMIHVRSFVDKIRPDVDILFRYPIRDNYMTAI